MTLENWQEAVKALEEITGPMTALQQSIVELLGSGISVDTPRPIADALISLELNRDLGLVTPRTISEGQSFRIDELSKPTDFQFEPRTFVEAEAYIHYLRLRRRAESIKKLQLNRGDIAQTVDGDKAEVSSIGKDGRIYFKGGQGFGSWPDLLSIIARSDDNSVEAQSARQQAANIVANRTHPSAWSIAKRHDLSEFVSNNYLQSDDLAELESVISKAEDERPIQKLLESNSQILTALLARNERYFIPRKRLGVEYITDFVIGDVDSMGVHWVLIELETPISGIYLKKGLALDRFARAGLQQIIDWRKWLGDNISYARKKRTENGLGLFDIHERTKAIVIVGRRKLMPETKDAQRLELLKANNIEIHTYDWLLEYLLGILQYQESSGLNPYLIRRGKDGY